MWFYGRWMMLHFYYMYLYMCISIPKQYSYLSLFSTTLVCVISINDFPIMLHQISLLLSQSMKHWLISYRLHRWRKFWRKNWLQLAFVTNRKHWLSLSFLLPKIIYRVCTKIKKKKSVDSWMVYRSARAS